MKINPRHPLQDVTNRDDENAVNQNENSECCVNTQNECNDSPEQIHPPVAPPDPESQDDSMGSVEANRQTAYDESSCIIVASSESANQRHSTNRLPESDQDCQGFPIEQNIGDEESSNWDIFHKVKSINNSRATYPSFL